MIISSMLITTKETVHTEKSTDLHKVSARDGEESFNSNAKSLGNEELEQRSQVTGEKTWCDTFFKKQATKKRYTSNTELLDYFLKLCAASQTMWLNYPVM